MSRALCCLILLLLPLRPSFAAPGIRSVELSDDPADYDYVFEHFQTRTDCVRADRGWVDGSLLADVDGDGYAELLNARNPGIAVTQLADSAFQGLEQWNLPVEFAWRLPCASLDGVWDVDGDGDPELVLTAYTEDRSRWRISLHDLDGLRERRVFELPGGPDLRADGVWDGQYGVLGPITALVDGEPRPALAVLCEAGFDLTPRGVLALDVRTGEVLWRYLTGPKPGRFDAALADLDGDGVDEILFCGNATYNLRDRSFNGTRDDRPMLFVLDADGTLRWRYDLPEGGGIAHMQVVEDADGAARRILLASQQHPDLQNRIRLLDLDGGLIDELEVSTGVIAVEPADPGGDPERFVAALKGGRLLELTAAGDGLRLRRVHAFPHTVQPLLVEDLVPEPGAEILLSTRNGHAVLCDAELRPLALLPDAPLVHAARTARFWRTRGGPDLLLTLGNHRVPGTLYTLAPAPRSFPWALAPLALLLLGGATLLRGRGRRRTSELTRRELRLQLLGRLELSGHGAIGALSSLRRLDWLLETVKQGHAFRSGVDDRLRTLWRDCRQRVLPAIGSTLELAGLARIGPDVVARAERARTALQRQLDLGDDADHGHLRDAIGALEEALQELRREVADVFEADPAVAVERGLDAHRDAIERLGVRVDVELDDAPKCRMDATEMAVVLDDLIGNALRALENAERRRLSLQGGLVDGAVRLVVRDTGEGIAPDDWERIFEEGYTTRPGGGLGLSRGRQILRRYGGSLQVVDSGPGRGATFELRVPPAESPDRLRDSGPASGP